MKLDMWLERKFGNASYSWPEFEGFCRTHSPIQITAEPRFGKREFFVRFRTNGARNDINLFYDKIYGVSFGEYPEALVIEERQKDRREVLLETYHTLKKLQKEVNSNIGETSIGIIKPGRWIIDNPELLNLNLIEEYEHECLHGPSALSPRLLKLFAQSLQ